MQNKRIEAERVAELALRALERDFGVSIALHDLRGTIRHPSGKVFLPKRHLHRHPCCLQGRFKGGSWDKRCFKSCFTESEKEAGASGEPFMKSCWKGLRELVVPLSCGGRHQLTLYAGVFKEPAFAPEPELAKDEAFMKAWESLEGEPSKGRLAALAALLSLAGRGMLASLREEEPDEDRGRGAAIRRFVADNAHRRIKVRDLAKALGLSPSRASHAAKEHAGMSFQDLLSKERMARAKTLLLRSNDSLEEIAGRTGFKNAFYFNRVFKRFFGAPPGRFRDREGRL